MKKKLRTIKVEATEYGYTVRERYDSANNTSTLRMRLYTIEQKNTPLLLDFCCEDHNTLGHPLSSGTELLNTNTLQYERVRLHRPYYVRALILQALLKGWTGDNSHSMGIQNGMAYLREVGFDVQSILPPGER